MPPPVGQAGGDGVQVEGGKPWEEGLTDGSRLVSCPQGSVRRDESAAPVLPETDFRQRQCSGHTVPARPRRAAGPRLPAPRPEASGDVLCGGEGGQKAGLHRAVCGPGSSSSAAMPWWHGARGCVRVWRWGTSASQSCGEHWGGDDGGVEPRARYGVGTERVLTASLAAATLSPA